MFDHPLHPAIVHFPIALLFTAVFFDLLGMLIQKEALRRAGYYLLILGILTGIVAFIAGEWTEEAVEAMGVPEEAIEDHENTATATLITFSLLLGLRWWLRDRIDAIRHKVIYFTLSMAGLVLLATTGFFGGELVYKHGAGVDTKKPVPSPTAPAPKKEAGGFDLF